MVEIAKEIDLRSPEFITSRRFFKPSFMKYLLVILSLILISSAHIGAIRYCDHLHSQLKTDTAALQKLKEENKPLMELYLQVSLNKTRSGLEHSVNSTSKPLHNYLVKSRQLADQFDLDLELATIDAGGQIFLKGTGPRINNVGLYNQALEDFSFIARSEITTINLGQEKIYYFEIQCLTKPKVEVAND